MTLLISGCGAGGGGKGESSKYPLHRNVKTTWFYVGEPATEENGNIPNTSSAWDDIWLWHYGGVDDPERRSGYFPASFKPSENPFYVALPFNDLDEKGNLKEIAKKIPWFNYEEFKKNGSVLKNRWVKIIKGDKVAYAQWEDVGPFGENDFNYVFGSSPPSNPVNGVGLDVSPAVRDYLGLKDVDYVDWQFVDKDEVPPGPWKEVITKTPVSFFNFPEISAKTTWYWQLQGELRADIPAELYDVDLFDTPKETIEKLKEEGKVVICYFSAGTYEEWRPDAGEFKEEELGNPLDEWPGEKWLDIRSENVKRIMVKRLELAKEKGCDGVEPDNVDGYLNDTGFPLTYEEQLDYNRFLSIEAKKRGLLVGLKNDLEQVKELSVYFDFAVNEECHAYNECPILKPFIEQGKPVFNAEYDEKYLNDEEAFKELCKKAEEEGIRTIVVPKELDGSFVKSCDYGEY
ncbi:endo alpha-1,4 polygalactosaminidase [Thermovibrio sp.]